MINVSDMDLEKVNIIFLNEIKEVREFQRYMRIKEQYLKGPFGQVDYSKLSEARDYLLSHKANFEICQSKALKDWERIRLSRTFDYRELGKIITFILEEKDGSIYYAATRLLKHQFQINNQRPFYQVVSFVTKRKEDLNTLLLDQLSPSMLPYYVDSSLIMRPLANEMRTLERFNQMIQRELEVRSKTEVYVVTSHDIPDELGFSKENKSLKIEEVIEGFDSVMEQIILKRYKQGGNKFSAAENKKIIHEYFQKIAIQKKPI